jgi:hypothetical protein
MSVSVTVPARLPSLLDDVLRALATFMPLSDMLVLVRCSRHFEMVLQSQLNRCLDQIFVVTHQEENWIKARYLQSVDHLPNQPEHWVLEKLFGKVDVCRNSRVYCFAAGKNILSLIQRKSINIFLYGVQFKNEDRNDTYYAISGANQNARDRFVRWLWYRCEQQLATEAHGNTTGSTCGVASDV